MIMLHYYHLCYRINDTNVGSHLLLAYKKMKTQRVSTASSSIKTKSQTCCNTKCQASVGSACIVSRHIPTRQSITTTSFGVLELIYLVIRSVQVYDMFLINGLERQGTIYKYRNQGYVVRTLLSLNVNTDCCYIYGMKAYRILMK
jgi:hypothetical protein